MFVLWTFGAIPGSPNTCPILAFQAISVDYKLCLNGHLWWAPCNRVLGQSLGSSARTSSPHLWFTFLVPYPRIFKKKLSCMCGCRGISGEIREQQGGVGSLSTVCPGNWTQVVRVEAGAFTHGAVLLALPQNLLGKIHNFCYECQVSRFLKPVLTMTFGFLLPNPSGYRADSKKLPASFQYLLSAWCHRHHYKRQTALTYPQSSCGLVHTHQEGLCMQVKDANCWAQHLVLETLWLP